MTGLRTRLRELPSFPDALPVLDPGTVPDDPIVLLRTWLDDAITSGERQPHALTFTTTDEEGRPAQRTLIAKDVDERGVVVSSSLGSRKARHLAARPEAGILFFWRASGRQAELTGEAEALSAEESAADWRERPTFDGRDNPDWQAWVLRPRRVEFLQATHDRRHTRVEYRRSDDGWIHGTLRPSEATGPRG